MTTRIGDVPDRICGPDGIPLFGAWRGVIPDGALRGLSAEYDRRGLQRVRTEKRWHFACIAGPEWIAAVAIIRLGYGGAAFAYLFDRESRHFVFDESTMAPPVIAAKIADRPGDGARSTFRMPGFHASILHPPGLGRYEVRLRLTGGEEVFDLAAELHTQGAPDGLTAICPIGGKGSVNLTVKRVAVPARGRLVIGERTLPFDEKYYAMLDYSHGFLDHTTSWMWACAGGKTARGRTVGLNLVAGFNDSIENVLWIGKDLVPVGPVSFHRDTSGPTAPWTIRDEGGRVDLTFTPEGVRADERDLGPLSTHYVQPVGTFSGTIKGKGKPVRIKDLAGVCEEHFSRW